MAVLYKRVYEALRRGILDGTYPVGTKLPSEAELSRTFSVSAITVKRAFELLRSDGLIVRRPRLGTFVTSSTPAPQRTGGDSAAGTPLIGMVLTNFDDTFGTHVIEGMMAAAGTDAHLIVTRSMGDVDQEDEHIRSLIDAGVAGLVLLPSSSEYIPPAALELVTQQFPIVILDRIFEGIPVSAVCSDNLGGARNATEHLLKLGHRTVGFVSSASHVSTSDDRRNGYVHAHATFHIPLENSAELRTLASTIPGSTTDKEADIEALTAFVRDHPAITGYLAAEYNIALLLREACRRIGLAVPDDISIVCFDHPEAHFDDGLFRFTHVRQQQRQLGRTAIERVQAQIHDRRQVEKVVLPTELIEGDSTAPPRAD
ncbi:GntR family transcriptional regulator [Phytoactinopolyspora halotolerans]|uniref:Substrate-binding domain-containing protein n=1 Tax=Phytoactinopolyspora halotolerans TaxID=1981512 RepID=A0A6L9SBH6_9ACTN|nr:GntR family transcriptional regulator [Phytoactinopolyspora halotolerans]NEE01994.1 substrate-binding domain-containing protein [Phytoactinopolyspora halotolerans]